MDEFEPARMSFNRVLADFYDTDIVQEVHIGVVKSFLLEKKTGLAKEYWLNKGQGDVVNDQLIDEINQLFSKAEK